MQDHPVASILSGRQLVAAAPNTSVLSAARLMADAHVGSVLVLDGERLVGIFTERDLLVRVVAAGLATEETMLSAVMTPDPLAIDRAQPLFDAIRLMDENGFRHLPVVDGGRVVGVIAQRDLPIAELAAIQPEIEERHWLAERMW